EQGGNLWKGETAGEQSGADQEHPLGEALREHSSGALPGDRRGSSRGEGCRRQPARRFAGNRERSARWCLGRGGVVQGVVELILERRRSAGTAQRRGGTAERHVELVLAT